ncbi:hypothetical protein L596_005472 [Steinernema carpocapsae]|uniref:Uncharacterized protein n=1 Tax=Steinernema carpocapsae TaxID=34508 RepID=A0A4U8V0K1_STECR|nr:hypothetical protein L596_005472 [Steinernema carpocapsae]
MKKRIERKDSQTTPFTFLNFFATREKQKEVFRQEVLGKIRSIRSLNETRIAGIAEGVAPVVSSLMQAVHIVTSLRENRHDLASKDDATKDWITFFYQILGVSPKYLHVIVRRNWEFYFQEVRPFYAVLDTVREEIIAALYGLICFTLLRRGALNSKEETIAEDLKNQLFEELAAYFQDKGDNWEEKFFGVLELCGRDVQSARKQGDRRNDGTSRRSKNCHFGFQNVIILLNSAFKTIQIHKNGT